MQHILDSQSSVANWLQDQQLPAYRAGQIKRWLFQSRINSFEDMSDLPQPLREMAGRDFTIWTTELLRHQQSSDGTEKLLLQLADGGTIECVLLREGIRHTICISTQVGCAMGCVFCASGLDGVKRNLTTGEIIEQMLVLQRLLPADQRLSHIVVMGMGEPLANLENLLPALNIASGSDGLGISARRITISTVGLPSGIRQLAKLNSRYQLAVSLHAPDDQLRNNLVPVNKNIGIQAILQAADHYFEVSSRRLTFEYVLLAEINDQPAHARGLVDILKHRNALLNIIPYNPVAGLPFKTPTKNTIETFRDILEKGNVHVQFRQLKGHDIDAACGQLRLNSPPTQKITT